MSTPTPTPINGTGLKNIFSFIGSSTAQIQLLIVGGLVVLVFVATAVFFSKRRKR
jgi:hypothetical protein